MTWFHKTPVLISAPSLSEITLFSLRLVPVCVRIAISKENLMAMSPSTSLDEFLADIRKLCRLESGKDMTVKWVDEEGKPISPLLFFLSG